MPTQQTPENRLAAAPRELDQTKLLIGEGQDEVFFFEAMLKHLTIEGVKVEDYGGKRNLPAYLAALVLRPGFANLTALGVTRDADTDASAAFASVRDHLDRRGFVVPNSPGEVRDGAPRVGVLILPDGEQPGMLEDLCLRALRTDSSFTCIDKYFECVKTAGRTLPNQGSKARVHAWLALQNPPDHRLGIAAQRGLINWGDPSFEQIRNFLKAL